MYLDILGYREANQVNFECLNEMVKYIEENLDCEIDFDKLSQITNTNLFILERIFMFLTNMTINEYIKKRRLSKAFEEIRNTDARIIDIAFKYQYNSAASFNRAFKRLFGITPRECRKGIGDYKIIPIEYFEPKKEKYCFDYRLKKLDSITLYCYHVSSKNFRDFLYKIKNLYKNVQPTEIYEQFNAIGMYGIFLKVDSTYNYYLGSDKYFPDLEKFEIEENEYAEFRLASREQNEIVNLEKRISNQWLPSTNYDTKNDIKIELYKGEYCYIYIPVK